ncbi:hypothetical protein HZA96_06650 [Candidatus Woesearchaeota archaeon]|nr:hypothetical protein [Candidatus Woesearchaeota archaeon]
MRKIIVTIIVVSLLLAVGIFLYKAYNNDKVYYQPKSKIPTIPISSIPESVLEKYNEVEKIYKNSYGTFLESCSNNKTKLYSLLYVVIGSGGFTEVQYYYDFDGKFIDEAYGSDVETENRLSEKINISDYKCVIIKQTVDD